MKGGEKGTPEINSHLKAFMVQHAQKLCFSHLKKTNAEDQVKTENDSNQTQRQNRD